MRTSTTESVKNWTAYNAGIKITHEEAMQIIKSGVYHEVYLERIFYSETARRNKLSRVRLHNQEMGLGETITAYCESMSAYQRSMVVESYK